MPLFKMPLFKMCLAHTYGNGNVVSEYALIGLILAGVCAAGLTGLGSAMNGQIQAFGISIGSPIPAKATSVNVPKPSDNLKAGGSVSVTPSTAPLISSDDVYTPAKTALIIEVAGANGATEQLAAALANRAQAMLAEGLITKDQANELIELANQGHYLASGQKVLEDALRTGQKSVMFEGKMYTTMDFTKRMVGYKRDTQAKENWALNPELASPILKPFSEKYYMILQGGILNNDEVETQVKDLVIQIGVLADALVWSSEDVLRGDQDNMNTIIAGHFAENVEGAPLATSLDKTSTSSLTDKNSAKICGLGAGQDSGRNCQEQ